MKIHKLTLFLLMLVLATFGFTLSTHTQTPSGKTNDRNQAHEKRASFPIADYDQPDLPDQKTHQTRKEKNLRHNNFRMIAKNPPEWQAELLVINEGALNFPALPVNESEVILVGQVKAAEAHVSQNKKNVYSEFRVAVSKVFKTLDSSISDGAEIVIDRIGGFVRYPNGRTVLYRLSNQNMPAVGEKYVFFLTRPNRHDLKLLTAYRLDPTGVTPLDESPQFERFRGTSEEVFLRNLQESLAKTSQN